MANQPPPSSRKTGRTTSNSRWTVLCLCIAGLACIGWIVSAQAPGLIRDTLHGRNDFLGLYVGAKLAGTGGLYDAEANRQEQLSAVGGTSRNLLFVRPPFYGFLLKPLTLLPYRAAYWTFQFLCLAGFAAFLFLFGRKFPALLFLASISVPLLMTIRVGEDGGLLVMAYSAFFLLSSKDRPLSAGLALSLCLIKPHLFVMTAVAVLVRREWRVAGGAVAGCAGLLALGFATQGWQWPAAYIARLRDPNIHPGELLMPNLHGLVVNTHGSVLVEAAAAVLVLAAFLWIVRSQDRSFVYSAALVTGLLLSFHAYPQDALLLLPAFAILSRTEWARYSRFTLTLALNPVAGLFLFAGPPYTVIFPCLLLLYLAVALCEQGFVERAGARHFGDLAPERDVQAGGATSTAAT